MIGVLSVPVMMAVVALWNRVLSALWISLARKSGRWMCSTGRFALYPVRDLNPCYRRERATS